jgi:hypothetical protein
MLIHETPWSLLFGKMKVRNKNSLLLMCYCVCT